MSRLVGALTAGIIVVVCAAGSAPSASFAPPAVTVVGVQPSDGVAVYVERVAAPWDGAGERWLINLDIRLKNTGGARLQLRRIELAYPGGAAPTYVRAFGAFDSAARLGAGETKTFYATDARMFPLPAPKAVVAKLYFRASDVPVTVGRPLQVWRSKLAGGAYLFPSAREDLPDGWYWADEDTHIAGGHRTSVSQRFAYDFGVRRWNGKQWTAYKQRADGTEPTPATDENEDYLIWDLPVRAMADGWVIRCVADVDDNREPGVEGKAGGNGFWIQHASGEVALYAHMRRGTVERKLCPRSRVDFAPNAIKVEAGQLLGHVGNSGQSSGPHLHVHIGTTDGSSGEGRPLHFGNIRTLIAGAGWKGSQPCNPKTKRFATTRNAAAGPFHLVEPLYRPGQREIARFALAEACFGDTLAALHSAGYEPSLLDGFDRGGKTYLGAAFRPASAEWRARYGLTATKFQTELEAAVAGGYTPVHVESYLRGGAARYAFVAEKGHRKRPYAVYHGKSAAQHEIEFEKAKAAGLRPVNIAVVSVKGKLLYTALWDSRSLGSWVTDSTLTETGYQRWAEAQARANRRLAYVNAYTQNGVPMFTAIAASKLSSTYQAQHGLSDTDFQTQSDKWWKAGLSYQSVAGYAAGDGTRWAAIWR